MSRFLLVVAGVGIAASLATTRPAASQNAPSPSQDQQDHQAHHPAEAPKAQTAEPPAAMGQKMMAEMHAGHAALDAMVARMNAAQGPAKVEAIATLLTALVERHKSMGEMMMHNPAMMQMHEQMMKKMGDHK